MKTIHSFGFLKILFGKIPVNTLSNPALTIQGGFKIKGSVWQIPPN